MSHKKREDSLDGHFPEGIYCPVIPRAVLRERLLIGKLTITGIGLEKKCGCCDEYWPCDTQFFYPNHSTSPDRLSNWCKACFMEKTARSTSLRRQRSSEAA